MQPRRTLDTPVTMRYIKYIVDTSRVCTIARVCMCVSCVCAHVSMCVRDSRLKNVRARVCLCVCIFFIYIIYNIYNLYSIPSLCRLSFVYCVALYQTQNFLGPSAILHRVAPVDDHLLHDRDLPRPKDETRVGSGKWEAGSASGDERDPHLGRSIG